MVASILSWNTLVTTLPTIPTPESLQVPFPVSNLPWLVKKYNPFGQLN
jgi:hypothetical protein